MAQEDQVEEGVDWSGDEDSDDDSNGGMEA